MTKEIRLPAEWEPQSAVQMTFPHAGTDWAPYLEEAAECFLAIAREIAQRQRLIVVCADAQSEALRFSNAGLPLENTVFFEAPTDDTWARDHAAISVFIDGKSALCDFNFNGWGNKYPSANDNRLTKRMYDAGLFAPNVPLIDMNHVTLEGGAIDSDGCGSILTTARCLTTRWGKEVLSRHCERSEAISTEQNLNKVPNLVKVLPHTPPSPIHHSSFNIHHSLRPLILHHGYLAGDDTDGHIDTLARFCDPQTIAYVQCTNPADEHYAELKSMEEELKSFRTSDGKPYRLLPLPLPPPIYYNCERLPATYANFLILNSAILFPISNNSSQPSQIINTFQSSQDLAATDAIAAEVLQSAFPNRQIIGIDCHILLRQHGSLHCLTMQFPQSFIK